MKAEEFLNQHLTISHFYDDITDQMVVPSSQLEQAMVDFAKMHVVQALKEASNVLTVDNDGDYINHPTKDSILNAYPLTNIK